MDPLGRGVAAYIALTVTTFAVHRRRWDCAALMSIASFVQLICTSARRAHGDVRWVVLVTVCLALIGIAWLLGTAFYWIARLEAERVSQSFLRRELEAALDIHDLVARNLVSCLTLLEMTPAFDRTSPEFGAELRSKLRAADKALRQITTHVHGSGSSTAFQGGSASAAFLSGVEELQRRGFAVAVRQPESLLDGLQPALDHAAARILGECLHNVAKHGCVQSPVSIVGRRTHHFVCVDVENGLREAKANQDGTLGLQSLTHHAQRVGGKVLSRPIGRRWTCSIRLPLSLELESCP